MLYMGDAGSGVTKSKQSVCHCRQHTGTYTKASSNPILNFGSAPSWDSEQLQTLSQLKLTARHILDIQALRNKWKFI